MQPPGLIMFDHYSNVLCPPASAKTAPWKGWSTPQPTISIPFLRLHEACRLIHILSVLADSSTLPKTRIAIQWPFHAGNLVESKNYHLFSNKTQWIYGGTKKSLHLEAQLDNQGIFSCSFARTSQLTAAKRALLLCQAWWLQEDWIPAVKLSATSGKPRKSVA